MEESRYDVIRQISNAQSQLNVLMNRQAQSPLPKPESLGFPAVDFEVAHVQALALANRPEVLSAARKIDAAKARLEAARREMRSAMFSDEVSVHCVSVSACPRRDPSSSA